MFYFIDGRPNLNRHLKELEKSYNAVILKDGEGKPIKISNDVDCDVPSLENYITEYILDVTRVEGIRKFKSEKPLVSCECTDCYESRDECCTAINGFPMVYHKNGRLAHTERDIIFECNSGCGCDETCANRQIQKGRQFKLEIFRTNSRVKGWGVRTLEEIPKGSYIMQYVGEVVSLIEAANRPTTYLFDLGAHLDSRDVEYTYVVDASRYGNVARFVNHSCAPNCRTLFAWIERSANTLLPIIALFAIKTIKPLEEITYDYSMEVIDYYPEGETDDSDTESEFSGQTDTDRDHTPIDGQTNVCPPAVASNRSADTRNRLAFTRIDCECGADNCKRFLYS